MLRGQPETHGSRGRDQSNRWGKGRRSGPNVRPALRYGTTELEARRKAVRQQATEPETLVTGRAPGAATGPRPDGHGSVRLTPQARADEKRPSLHRDDRSLAFAARCLTLSNVKGGSLGWSQAR